jgi:hypothetical protein
MRAYFNAQFSLGLMVNGQITPFQSEAGHGKVRIGVQRQLSKTR